MQAVSHGKRKAGVLLISNYQYCMVSTHRTRPTQMAEAKQRHSLKIIFILIKYLTDITKVISTIQSKL